MYNKSICKTTRLYFSRKICEKFKKIERDLDTFKTFHSRVEHVHLKPFEEFFFVKKLVRLFSKRIKLHLNYLSKQIHFLSHQLFNLYLHNSKYFVIALSFFSFLFSFNFNKILSLSFFHHYFSNNNQKTSSIETVHDEYTNEFPQTIRHSLVERAHACIRVQQEDKEVVVNALTLICQEFCRTRTYGETREERQLEELLSHTTLRKACCTRTNTRERAIHLYTSAGQRVSNGFSHRVDVLPKLPNRVSHEFARIFVFSIFEQPDRRISKRRGSKDEDFFFFKLLITSVIFDRVWKVEN